MASGTTHPLCTQRPARTLRKGQIHFYILLRTSKCFFLKGQRFIVYSLLLLVNVGREAAKKIRTIFIQPRCTLFQTRFDYLSHVSLTVDPDLAVQLCCLEVRRYFKDVSPSALEKKSNIEYLEKEFGLRSLLPESVIASIKTKNLKKMIQQQFKKCIALAESACMFKFLDLLRAVYRYDRESFQCGLGVCIFNWILLSLRPILYPIFRC